MPIGKNSIKRVTNNGYSKVTTSAPDMENSVAIEEKKVTKKEPSAVEPVAKKPAAKPTAVKNTATVSNKKPSVKKPVKPKEATVNTEEKKENTSYVNLGRDLPNYLL